MKTREQVITSMCLTWRHDYFLERSESGFGSGMTRDERDSLWSRMAQIFDNDIAPHMQFRREERPQIKLVRDGIIKVHSFEFTDYEKKRISLGLRYGPDAAWMRGEEDFFEAPPRPEPLTILRRILRFLGLG
jgi:hypothetical protein